MADPKPNLDGVTRLWNEIKKLKSDVARLGAPSGTEKRLTTERLELAIEELQETQSELAAVQAEQAAQIAYLQGLGVTGAGSSQGITTFGPGWAGNELRPSVTVRTSTGKLLVTVSATLGNAVAVYSIPGYVDRADLIAGTGLFNSLNATSDVNHTVGGSRQFVVTGLPVNTNITVFAEPYSMSPTGFAARPNITAQTIP